MVSGSSLRLFSAARSVKRPASSPIDAGSAERRLSDSSRAVSDGKRPRSVGSSASTLPLSCRISSEASPARRGKRLSRAAPMANWRSWPSVPTASGRAVTPLHTLRPRTERAGGSEAGRAASGLSSSLSSSREVSVPRGGRQRSRFAVSESVRSAEHPPS